MDRLTDYRRAIRQVINDLAQQKPSHGQVEAIPICDSESDNYLVMYVGWSSDYRHDDPIVHLRLRDSQVWVEHDGTDEVVDRLVKAGIPKRDIVLALDQPHHNTPAAAV